MGLSALMMQKARAPMKFWDKIKQRHRLRRIERAIGVRLSKEQRQIVLCPDRPYITGERRSGKSLTACMWVLMHRKEPIIMREELNVYSRNQRFEPMGGYKPQPFAVPDPDLGRREMAVWCLNNLADKWEKCKRKKIPVFDLYGTYEQYRKAQEGKQ